MLRSMTSKLLAFAAVPATAGRFGTAAKGTIKGPGINCWDLGVYKQLALTEKLKLNSGGECGSGLPKRPLPCGWNARPHRRDRTFDN